MTRPWTFGRKVFRLLEERRAAGRTPATAAALARAIPCDPGALYKWRDLGSEPTAGVALRVARTLGVPLDWLCDGEQAFPEPAPSRALLAAVRALPSREHEALLGLLSSHGALRSVLAAWRAR